MAATFLLEKLSIPGIHRPIQGTTTRRRIYILPTRHGLLFGGMLLAMLLGAVNYNNSMAYILTFLLGSLALVTMLHTYKNLAGLAISEGEPAAVFAGRVAAFPFIFDNRGGPARDAVMLARITEHRWWRVLKEHDRASATIGNVGADALTRIELPFKAGQRGRLRAGRIKIHTLFPLGLFRAWSYIDTERTCLVYPAPVGERVFPPFAHTQEAQSTQGGATGTSDFVGYRAYREGDSPRKIAWKVYAQEKGFLIKHFAGAGSDKLRFGWDEVAHLADTEARLSQLCLWIVEANVQRLQYGLTLPNVHIETDQGQQHFERCLAALALFRTDNSDGA